jgi:steroid delta-isomerase-like uncharacterized protein
MDTSRLAHTYFDAWNRRDPAAIASVFADQGTYRDPATGQELRGAAIGAYASELFTAFPDLSFDVIAMHPAGDRAVVARWVMRGTNTGPFRGAPPTGRTVTLPGVDLLTVRGDRILSVEGYFDRLATLEQLGFQIVVQPERAGPASFGTSVHIESRRRGRPGAFSLTWIDTRSDAEAEQVQQVTRTQIIPQLVQLDGFMGLLAARVGHRLFTITAWERPDQPRQLAVSGPHQAAADRMLRGGFSLGGQAGVWTQHHVSPVLVRCSCGELINLDNGSKTCVCGRPAPEPAPW